MKYRWKLNVINSTLYLIVTEDVIIHTPSGRTSLFIMSSFLALTRYEKREVERGRYPPTTDGGPVRELQLVDLDEPVQDVRPEGSQHAGQQEVGERAPAHHVPGPAVVEYPVLTFLPRVLVLLIAAYRRRRSCSTAKIAT